MFDKMKQLMDMKKQAERIKRELEALEVEANDIDGITVKVNGTHRFQSIVINESLLAPENKARLENDLLKSVNAAIKKAEAIAAQKMKDVMPGFPGL